MSAVVQTVHRRKRSPLKPQFAVVVVLDEISLRLFRSPFQQFCPSAHRHNDARRKLVGWRNVGNGCTGLTQCLYFQSALIHGNSDNRSTIAAQDVLSLGIARLFHSVSSGSPQQLDKNPQQIFRSGAHQNLFRSCMNSPKLPQMGRNCPTKRIQSHGRRCVKQCFLLGREHLSGQLCPRGKGELFQIHTAGGKINLIFWRDRLRLNRRCEQKRIRLLK